MTRTDRKTIRFRGRTEPVIQSFHVRGRSYFALEKLARRGAFRVFDPHAGPYGDYRVLHQIPKSKMTRQRIEILRRVGGPSGNRNFPAIVDFAKKSSDFVVVFAWVSGTNLRTYLKAVRHHQTPRPSVSEVVRLVRGLVHGVSHYHRRTNIIHGDITPANIVITQPAKHLVLIDFGSAWPIEDTPTRERGHGFTQPYAAPERIAQHAAEDFRSDAFSLSVIAYEMLTLSIPYEGLGGQAGTPKIITQTTDSYRDPSASVQSGHRLPKTTLHLMDDCIRTGLELHPDQRFATSSEWLSAWDSVHFSLKKGRRLTRLEELVLSGIDSLISLFSPTKR